MNKFRFVGILFLLLEIKKQKYFGGYLSKQCLYLHTTALFSRYGTGRMEGRKEGRKEGRERGEERRKVGWIGGRTDGHYELCELSVFP